MAIEQLESEALQLPPDARERLAETLLASLGGDLEHEEEWIAEAERRFEELTSGSVEGVPIEDILERLRTRYS